MNRYLFVFIFCCVGGFSHAQFSIQWNAGADVAPSSFGNEHPRIAVDANGNPLVLWHASNSALFSRWNGSGFTTPVLLNPVGIDVAGASWMGPDIASHGDTVYVVVKQIPESSDSSHIFCVRSFDGGVSFSTPVRVDNIADSLSRFPAVTTDDAGNPVIGFMKFDAAFSDSRWVVTRSLDHGLTFSVDTKASGWSSPTSVICDCCPGAVVCAGTTVGMLYRDNDSDLRDIWVGVSNDGGNSFTGGMNIDQNYWNINACPATGPDGVIVGDTLYSTYMSGAGGTSLVYWNASSLSAMNALPGREMTGNFSGLTQQNYPRIATDGSALAMVWKQRVNSRDQCILRLTPEAAGFSNAITDTVDLDNITNADVALAGGNVFVVWEDGGSGTVKFRSGTYTNSTGINVTNAGMKISIYPNPSTSRVNIRSGQNMDELKILNSYGQLVDQVSEAGHSFVFNAKTKGIYFVKILSGNEEVTKKVVVVQE